MTPNLIQPPSKKEPDFDTEVSRGRRSAHKHHSVIFGFFEMIECVEEKSRKVTEGKTLKSASNLKAIQYIIKVYRPGLRFSYPIGHREH